MLKLTDTRNIIRKKFKKACLNRLECERDANQAMKPLATINTDNLTSVEHDSPLPKATTTTKTTKIYTHQSRIIENDPNDLCARLRSLLASKKSCDYAQRIEEIKSIIAKLYDLNVLVK